MNQYKTVAARRMSPCPQCENRALAECESKVITRIDEEEKIALETNGLSQEREQKHFTMAKDERLGLALETKNERREQATSTRTVTR